MVVENPESRPAQAERLRVTRLALMREWGMKYERDFCKRIKISQNRWRFYERGQRGVPPDTALRLNREFRVPITWIYQGARFELQDPLLSAIEEVERNKGAKIASKPR